MALTASSQAKAKGRPTTLILTILGLAMMILGILFLPGHLATVEITAVPLFHIGGIPITNAYLTSWISLIILIGLFWAGSRSMQLVPHGIQNAVEAVIDGLLGLAESVAGKEKGREFFALFATIFLYVLLNNWLELLPGFTNATVFVTQGAEQVPLFRSPSADLNFTLALAVSAVFMVQFWSVKHTGWGVGEQVHQPARWPDWLLRRTAGTDLGDLAHHLLQLPFVWQSLRRVRFCSRLSRR